MEIQQRRELWSEEGERRLLKRECVNSRDAAVLVGCAFSFQHFSLFVTLLSHLQTGLADPVSLVWVFHLMKVSHWTVTGRIVGSFCSQQTSVPHMNGQ